VSAVLLGSLEALEMTGKSNSRVSDVSEASPCRQSLTILLKWMPKSIWSDQELFCAGMNWGGLNVVGAFDVGMRWLMWAVLYSVTCSHSIECNRFQVVRDTLSFSGCDFRAGKVEEEYSRRGQYVCFLPRYHIQLPLEIGGP
jgi:hypothetical protein